MHNYGVGYADDFELYTFLLLCYLKEKEEGFL